MSANGQRDTSVEVGKTYQYSIVVYNVMLHDTPYQPHTQEPNSIIYSQEPFESGISH